MREWKTGDPPLTDKDGTRLLFIDEVAEATGRKRSTIYWKNAAAKTARRNHRQARFPAPAMHVRRTTPKADGQPVTAQTPVWREDVITAWCAANPLRRADSGDEPEAAAG